MITSRTLGARLRGYRLVRGMTLDGLSLLTSIPVSALEVYEQGRRVPNGIRMIILMDALSLTPAELLDAAPVGVSA